MNIKTIIFDLDDTIFDTTGQLLHFALQESLTTMNENGFSLEFFEFKETFSYMQTEFPEDNVFFKILEKHNSISKSNDELINISTNMTELFYNRKVSASIHPFDGAVQILEKLKENYDLYLVTYGHPETQLNKIKLLEISNLFKFTYIVGVHYNNKKITAFKDILQRSSCQPNEVLCVGNRRDSEIEDANLLKMNTCYLNHGEHKNALPRNPNQVPDFTINDFSEIINTCQI